MSDGDLHETHVCRDCGAEITIPFVSASQLTAAVEGLGNEEQCFCDFDRRVIPGRSGLYVNKDAVLALLRPPETGDDA